MNPRTKRKPKVKAQHHRGTYQRRAEKIVAAANRNSLTRCWRCGRTIAEVRARKPHATWQAGHVINGQVNGELRAECSPCNLGAGARHGNRLRKTQRPQRTDRLNRSRSW